MDERNAAAGRSVRDEPPQPAVLLVDDRPDNLLAFRAALDDVGYEVHCAGSGAEGVAATYTRDHAVVLVDLRMPGMDGLEVASAIRASDAGRETPVVLVTAGDVDDRTIARAYELGVADFLRKPVDPTVLAAKVRVFADLWRARHRAAERSLEDAERRAAISEERQRVLFERLSRLQSVTAALAGAASVVDVARVIVENAVAALGADTCVVYSAREEDRLVLVDHRGIAPELIAGITNLSQRRSIDPSGQPMFVETAEEYARRYPEVAGRAATGPRARAFWSMPLVARGAVVGLLGMGYYEERRFDEEQRSFIHTFAQQCALALDRARVFDEEHAQFTQLQIADNVARILGSSIDYETTLQNVARSVVPHLGDWCAVDLLDDEGTLAQVALAHVDPQKLEYGREYRRRHPPHRASPGGPYAVAQSGRGALYPEITDEMLAATARSPEHLAMMRELGMRSAMLVPLRARGRTVGVMTLVSGDEHRRYTPTDLTLAEDLASRAALAVENARLHEDARQAVRLRDEFLTIASHELRTPLATLKLRAERLLRAQLDAEAVTAGLRTIDAQVDRLHALVTRLLDVSQLREDVPIALELEPVDLRALIEEVLAARADAVTRAGNTLQADLANVTVRADRERLRELFEHLVRNALEHAPGTRVEISLRAVDGFAEIAVADAGAGVAPVDRARIFERFERARHDRMGLGVGLWIVRRIAEAHGGRAFVESAGESGARFVVRLPPGGP